MKALYKRLMLIAVESNLVKYYLSLGFLEVGLNIVSLILYSFVMLVCVFIAFLSQNFKKNKIKTAYKFPKMGFITKTQRKLPIISLLIITMILSLYSTYLAMSGVFPDTVRYAWSFLYRYPSYYESFESMISSGTETGFLILNMVVYYFTKNVFWLFLIVALTTTFINLSVAKKISKSYAMVIFLYIGSLYFFYSSYLLRQALAVSFANLAFLYYLKGSSSKYFILSTIALAFHATSIVLFPLFFVLKKINNRKSYLVVMGILLVSFFFLGPIFSSVLPNIPYLGQYMIIEEDSLSLGGGTLTVIFKGLPFYFITVVALIKRKELIKVIQNADFYIINSLLYSFSWLFSYNLYWFFRLGWFFMLPTLVLVPVLFSTVKNPKERLVYYIILIFSLVFLTFRQIYITFY